LFLTYIFLANLYSSLSHRRYGHSCVVTSCHFYCNIDIYGHWLVAQMGHIFYFLNVDISFTQIFPLGMGKVYYLCYLILSKSIYHNQMHIQGCINLKKNALFISFWIYLKNTYIQS
jgi:hypothetical protein